MKYKSLAALALLASTFIQPSQAEEGVLTAIKQAGVVRIGTTGDYKPSATKVRMVP